MSYNYDQSSMAAWIADMRSRPELLVSKHGVKGIRRSEAYRIFKRALAICIKEGRPYTNRMLPPTGSYNGKKNPTGSDVRFDYWMNYYQFAEGTYSPVVTWRTRNAPFHLPITRSAPNPPQSGPGRIGRPIKGEEFHRIPRYEPDPRKRWHYAMKKCRIHKREFCWIPGIAHAHCSTKQEIPKIRRVSKAKRTSDPVGRTRKVISRENYIAAVELDYAAMKDPLIRQCRSLTYPFVDAAVLLYYGVPEKEYLSTIVNLD